MTKEWILNNATNRWGLNKKKSVGPVAEWIRDAAPESVEAWRKAYLTRLAEWLKSQAINLSPEEYLESLADKLFVKITEVIRTEVEEITREDCANYIRDLVIKRTFEGYQREITTIHELLQTQLGGLAITPAPDEWDRLYNVDFYIQVGSHYVGIQIKPVTYKSMPELHRWQAWMENTHRRFREKFGGQVFIVYSIGQGRQKELVNPEVVEGIREEIARLRSL